MKHVISGFVTIVLLVSAAAAPASAADTVYFALGERHELKSEILGRHITLLVREPEQDNGEPPGPVLYVVGSDWRGRFAHLVSTVELLESADHIPKMLVVGVDLPEGNGVLIPCRDQGDGAGTDEWLQLLTDELFPYVEETWNAAPYRVVFGASNSGLFVLWALLDRSDAINAVVAASPMIGWCPELLNEKFGAWIKTDVQGERALAVIWSDDDYSRVTEHVPAFAERLGQEGPDWLRWSSDEVLALGHVPPGGLALGLRQVFSDWAIPRDIGSVNEVVSHFEGLQNRFGFPVPVPAGPLFNLGVEAWRNQRFSDAREAFAAVSTYAPGDPTGPAGLALVAYSEGRIDEARALALQATELDPESGIAQRVLQRVSVDPDTDE
jgi:enterochelin esterase-like enzyme